MTNICVNENSKFYFDFFLSVSYSISSWSAFPLSEAFDKGDEKSVLYMYCPSAFSGVLVWTIGESENTTEYVALSNENALVWAGEKFENAILVEKLFCFCFLQNENGDFWKYISMVGALHPSRIPRCSQTSVYRADQFAVSLFHTKSD